jgi:antitoxin component of RelBE/YafQ-DinJ toxin-antitoxin module
MAQTIIQIPVDKKLRNQAVRVANQGGFSSVQEVIRLFLSQFANEEIRFQFINPAIDLSEVNEARYVKMVDEVKAGKVKTKKFKEVTSLMKDLDK